MTRQNKQVFLLGVIVLCIVSYSTVEALDGSCTGPQRDCDSKHNRHQQEKYSRETQENSQRYNKELRIVVVGKTGTGKSSTINTIAGKKLFNTSAYPSSVTKHCQFAEFEVEGKPVLIVDTPGVFDTDTSREEIVKELARVVTITSPGFHVFIIVIKMGNRFTEEEYNSILFLREIFGPELYQRSVIVFTGLDNLEADGDSFDSYITSANGSLAELIADCGNRTVPFNNRLILNENARMKQVRNLMGTIKKVLEAKSSTYYTSEMYEEIQIQIEKEIERRLAEQEAKRKEEERKNQETEKLRKDFEEAQRKQKISEEELERERNRRKESEERQRQLERDREWQRERGKGEMDEDYDYYDDYDYDD